MNSEQRISELWANLHERVAGTPGAHELAELQKLIVTEESLALWFTPGAIRDHFEDDLWVQAAPDEQLRSIGMDALQADYIYEAFHDALIDAVGDEKDAARGKAPS